MVKKDLRTRFVEVKQQINEVYAAAKNEQRALTDAESAQVATLRTELSEIQSDILIESAERAVGRLGNVISVDQDKRSMLGEQIRSIVTGAAGTSEIQLRASALIDKADAQPLVALTIGDIIGPLEKGMVLDKVGCKIQTGLTDDWIYPVVEAIEASVAGESVNISDSDIEINSVKPTPQRVAVSVPITRTALAMTNERLAQIVISSLRKAIQRTLNDWMFKRTAIAAGVNGLFVSPTTVKTYANTPSYANICSFVGDVDSTGVVPSATAAFVMNNAMRATLKSTPRVEGGERMIIENDEIDGIPVFVTEYATAGTIEFGYFSYALVGQFGDSALIVDPYSLAKKNQIQFTLNSFWDIKAARAQAFGVLEKAS